MKSWIQVARSDDVTPNGGSCVLLGGVQIALFKLQHPGGAQGELKVACPLHKNAFSLRTGEHLGGGSAKGEWSLETFLVKEVEGVVFIEFDTARLTPPPAKTGTGVSREPGDAYRHGLPN